MTLNRLLPLVLAAGLAACSSLDDSNDRIDYRSGGTKRPSLEVPPDLTQLARDTRYQSPGGVVSAANFQAGAASAPVPSSSAAVAPQPSADLRIERERDKRWLVTSTPPEQLWPQLRAFWKDRGFELVLDQPDAGLMETEWAENRAKLPDDFIRRTLGRVVDGLYSTGERDKFRTRVERNGNLTEVFITHRGMAEVYTSQLRDATVWQPRPADPELEAELLSRLMVRLGTKPEVAQAAVTTPAAAPARARVIEGQGAATLSVDDNFDRAWRRVGQALDRGGFTVEDRDRAQGLYFVRYVDPGQAAKEQPGFLTRLFSSESSGQSGPTRYRVLVKGQGDVTTVAVLNAQGAPEAGDAGKRIVALLVDDLK
jgi:outer membrane protein assembly factor BamC